jgi:hypothetical protein
MPAKASTTCLRATIVVVEANRFTMVRFGDGSDNDEREPDIEYVRAGAYRDPI